MHAIDNPPPISFDKALESRSISTSNCSLLKLPFEILNNIGSQIPTRKSDLASLALVNTYFRQLARSWQFRIIKLDGSRSSEKLLRLLQQEAVERGRNHGRTHSFSLGACVRRVITNNHGFRKEIIASRSSKSGKSVEDNFDPHLFFDQEWIAQLQPSERELEKRFNENYRPNVLSVLSSLIHLESLDIGKADWNQTFLNTLIALPIKYLMIRDAQMSDVITVMDVTEWPLERLTIHLNWSYDFIQNLRKSRINSSKIWEVALGSCAPFLQVLWISQSCWLSPIFDEEYISFVLKFPRLRQLDLMWEWRLTPPALRSLVFTSSCLTNLAIYYGDSTRRILDREGRIESLKTLILNPDISKNLNDVSFNFLKINLQLEGLGFHKNEPHTLLERVLQLLRKFEHLKMLSMTWDSSKIPESSLEKLALLSLIENLHLSSGIQSGLHHDWFINHQTMLEKLKPLRRLKRLAFTRDTYSYTRNKITTNYNNYEDISLEALDLHCHYMSETAIAYATAFPNLKLLHIGKITYDIFRFEKHIKLVFNDDQKFSWESEILNMYS